VTALALLPVALSLLLLAAHFLRVGAYPAVAALLCLIPLLGLRRRWVPRVEQSVLWLGAAFWLYTILRFTAERLRFGQPWLRMALILGGVASFTALSSLVFRSNGLRAWYGRVAADGAVDGPPPAEPERGS